MSTFRIRCVCACDHTVDSALEQLGYLCGGAYIDLFFSCGLCFVSCVFGWCVGEASHLSVVVGCQHALMLSWAALSVCIACVLRVMCYVCVYVLC